MRRIALSQIYGTLASTLRGLTGSTSGGIVARGASISLAMRIGSMVAAYVANIFLARWMGITAYGQYVYALGLAIPLAVAGGLGIDRAALRYVPAYAATSSFSKIRGLIRWSRLRVVLGSLTVAALVALGVVVAGDMVSTDLRISILSGCALTPLLAVTRLNSSTLLGFKKVGLASLNDLLRPVLLLLLAGAFTASMGILSVQTAVTALGVSLICIIGLQTALVYRSCPSGAFDSAPVTEPGLWKTTIRAMFVIQILQIVMSKLDIILLGGMVDVESVAVYGVARRIAVLIGFSEVAIAMMAQPVISELHAEGKRDDVRRVIVLAAHISLWPTLAAALIIGLFSDTILGMFGEEFVAGSSTLWVLLGAQVLHAMVSPAFILLTFTGYHNFSARLTALVFLLNACLLTAGIHWMGLAGAAWASVATALLWNVILHTWIWRTLKIVALPIRIRQTNHGE